MNVHERALLNLAGRALAHAAGSIETGESRCTLAMLERASDPAGRTELYRFEADSIPNSVDNAHMLFADLN